VSQSDLCFMNIMHDLDYICWRQKVFTGKFSVSGLCGSLSDICSMNIMHDLDSV
jgi:hypothetical protein